MVGKVSMDRNSPDYLREQDAQTSLKETVRWLNAVNERNYLNTQPILTPRFTPSCTDELMKGLGNLRHDWQLPLQSHLSENLSEIDWVKELCPWSSCYGETYEHFGELAGEEPVIMAHCNWSSDEEIEILKRNGVTIAHCPQSNAQLASGIAPIRRYLNEDMQVGLGTDIAGGASLNMFRACADAVMVSKLRWRMVDQDLSPLTTTEAFYLATQGGGQVYGKVGSFDWGYDADILVLDDSALATPIELTLSQRFERYMYLADEGGHLVDKFVAGQRIDLS
jgi:guanine deaminase